MSSLPELERPPGEPLAEVLGHEFNDPRLLEQALTHRSFANENPAVSGDNERLEYLGDAVVDLVVAAWLYEAIPEAGEGVLTAVKARLVREDALAEVGRALDLGAHLRLGVGEERTGGRTKNSLLADCVEAVTAAIFLDGGYEAAVRCVSLWMGALHPDPRLLAPSAIDPRSKLQELAQSRYGHAPSYTIDGQTGPDHELRFVALVSLPDFDTASGEGTSKKEAKRRAAEQMLAQIDAEG